MPRIPIHRAAPLTLLAVAGSAAGEEILVSSAAEVQAALASLDPGDELVLADGLWLDQYVRIQANGTQAQPIIVRPQTPGQARFTGSSRLDIGGSWIVVEDLFFDQGQLDSNHVIQFRSSTVARNCTLRRCVINDYNAALPETRYFWVSLYGSDNTVEDCVFEGMDHNGVTLCIWEEFPNRHVVRGNHFLDRAEDPQGGNGWETIRIGTSSFVDLSSDTIVENNLFERCDGEIEIISSKTGNNIIRYNTFLESKGTVTLRHSFGAQVHGNFFLGNDRSATGGVRVVGPGHRVYHNYFERLAGRDSAVINLYAGQPNAENSGYLEMDDVVIAHNTIVDCGFPAFDLATGLGSRDRTILPTNTLIAANLVSIPGETVATDANPGVTFADNLTFAQSLGTAQAVALAIDPLGPVPSDIQRPIGGSPGLASATYINTPEDIDGQARPLISDIGADYVSTDPVLRRPLTSGELGPAWYTPGGSGVDPNVNPFLAAVVEAEAPDQLLDPNGSGGIFEFAQEPSASGGQVLKSSSDSSSTSSPDDAIAVFTVTPPVAGTYTAYYKARGFSTSTDSFYTPATLDTDPTQVETTTSNGAFRWETGDTYDFTGGPQQLRLGRRERNTEIDAIVFYPDAGLAPFELDFLLANPASCEGDFDGDFDITTFDTIEYLRLFAAGDPAADLSGDGNLNSSDILRHLAAVSAGCQ